MLPMLTQTMAELTPSEEDEAYRDALEVDPRDVVVDVGGIERAEGSLMNEVEEFNKSLNELGEEKANGASQEEREPVEGKEKFVQQLKSALQERDVGTHTPRGQHFR